MQILMSTQHGGFSEASINSTGNQKNKKQKTKKRKDKYRRLIINKLLRNYLHINF